MKEDMRTPETETEHIERLLARGLVVAGGLFWMVAAFAGPYAYGGVSLSDSIGTAVWPLVATIVTLVVGWRHEHLAAVLLFAASAAVFVWGTLYQWELGVWVIMNFVLIAPMAIAGVLFTLSARAETRRVISASSRRSVRVGVAEPARDARTQASR